MRGDFDRDWGFQPQSYHASAERLRLEAPVTHFKTPSEFFIDAELNLVLTLENAGKVTSGFSHPR
jgi:hypothetical protein